MNVWDYISADRDVCHGKPCFKGTRIMVSSVLALLEAGDTPKEILAAYPGLTLKHIQAALHLAEQLLEGEQYLHFPSGT